MTYPQANVTLITGGVRSGKSNFAQSLASQYERHVRYLATAEAKDEEMRRRILHHQKIAQQIGRLSKSQYGLINTLLQRKRLQLILSLYSIVLQCGFLIFYYKKIQWEKKCGNQNKGSK